MAGKLRALGEQYYTSAFEIKSVEDDGIFTGYASVFTKDSDGDVIVKGAFARTIKNKGGRVPILWQHDKAQPIGVNLEMKEDGHGLFVKGQLNLDVEKGRDARSLVKQGALGGLSIGFFLTQPPEWKDGVRYIKEVNLMEYSMVTFPANTSAQVEQMKGGHIVTGKAASTDFTAVLAQQQAESDLWDERYRMESALRETIRNIIGDGDSDDDDTSLDKNSAVAAISTAYAAFGTAMIEWWGKYIDVMGMTDDEGLKSANLEQKAKAKLASSLRRIADAHHAAMNASQNSQNLHRKALDLTNQMVYSHLIQGDRNAPNPMPKGNPPQPPPQDEHLPEKKQMSDLLDSLRALVPIR